MPQRATSPAVGAVLVVVLTVALAAATGTPALAYGERFPGPAPQFSVEPGALSAADPAPGNQQAVRLTHVAGDSAPVEQLAVVVTVESTGDHERVTGLPVPGDDFDPASVEGDRFLDESSGGVSGPVTVTAPDTDGVWSAVETVVLRIDESEVSLAPGDAVTVRVVNAPSGSTVLTRRLVAG